MRIVFMGTPDFAVPSLRALLNAGHEVVAVYTQPDRPAGRGKQLKSSPVKIVAQEFGLQIYQPNKIKAADVLTQLQGLQPECIVVVAYGQILSKEILNLPKLGSINVHASLLPAYRGAAPIHWAIMNGEVVTGVTTMLMDEGLDTGNMLLKKEYYLTSEVTTGEVHDVLAEYGGELLGETLSALEAGVLLPRQQEGVSSYAPLLTRETEKIDWRRSRQDIHNQIRGLNPWPGAFTVFRGENVKIWRSKLLPEALANTAYEVNETEEKQGDQRGTILAVSDEGIRVLAGDGVLLVTEVQPAGRRPMPARDFFLGRHGRIGEAI